MVGSANSRKALKSPDSAGIGFRDRVVYQGISVEAIIEPIDPTIGDRGLREGDDVRFRFHISDTTTGSPLSGVYPAAWMDHLVRAIENDARSCEEKIGELVGGSIFSQAELDLNVYYVLALNQDPSITVVDPLFGFGNTKLLTLIELESPGEDWVLTEDRRRLFVSMPEAGKVAAIDTASWRVIANLEVNPSPRRVDLQPDGVYLWVTFEGKEGSESGVAVFDARTLKARARIVTGRGAHEIDFSQDVVDVQIQLGL